MPHTAELTPAIRECINTCQDCHAICLETVSHCLKIGGKHAADEHIRLLLDCAEICATSANYMLRGSPDHVRTCEVCAQICEKCASSCKRLAGDDQTMRQCAETCRRCAETCDEMARTAA